MGNSYLLKRQVEQLKKLYNTTLEDYRRSREELLDFADEIQRAWDRQSSHFRMIATELQEVVKFLEQEQHGYVRIVNRPEYKNAQAERQAAEPRPPVPEGEQPPSESVATPEANE
jgi:hypothetical protein